MLKLSFSYIFVNCYKRMLFMMFPCLLDSSLAKAVPGKMHPDVVQCIICTKRYYALMVQLEILYIALCVCFPQPYCKSESSHQ